MNNLQGAIHAKGQVVSRVRRDLRLMTSGYQTAEHRLMFFGKQAEIGERLQPTRNSALSLTIVVFAEGNDGQALQEAGIVHALWDPGERRRAIFDGVARNP
jgi:hypothetical protein